MSAPRGFIALTSVMIISVVLLIVVFAGSTRHFYARFDALEAEYKAQSRALAEACLAYAKIELVRDEAYPGEESYDFDQGTCDIGEVTSDERSRDFSISGESNHAITHLSVSFDVVDLSETVSETP